MPALAISVWSYETNKKDSPRKGAPMTVSFEGILLLKAHPEKHKKHVDLHPLNECGVSNILTFSIVLSPLWKRSGF